MESQEGFTIRRPDELSPLGEDFSNASIPSDSSTDGASTRATTPDRASICAETPELKYPEYTFWIEEKP